MRRTRGRTKQKAKQGSNDFQALAKEIVEPSHLQIFKGFSQEKRKQLLKKYGSIDAWRKARAKRLAKKFPEDFEQWPKGKPLITKVIRQGKVAPKPPVNPYAALMTPMTIVPDAGDGKPIIADAGSIVRFMDQSTLYRNYISPITRRGDEVLVQYGNPQKLALGWLSHKIDPKAMKPVKGPTFLVTTKDETQASAWDQLRLLAAQYRKGDSSRWIGTWLHDHGAKHQRLLREVTRLFGGKPIKNEPFEQRALRLLQLITHTEIETMPASKKTVKAASKKSSKKATKAEKVAPKKATKPAKSSKKTKAPKSRGEFTATSREYDDAVIRRLVKENPRRAGSTKAKIWDKLRKGMTVGEFVKKGGSRGTVRKYLDNGWVKLLPAGGGKSSSSDE